MSLTEEDDPGYGDWDSNSYAAGSEFGGSEYSDMSGFTGHGSTSGAPSPRLSSNSTYVFF